jgi:hypothetical protein
MKILLLSLSLVVAAATSASAQIYQPTVVRDSVIGAVAGALIGGHNHDHWAEGAAIGAAAGAIVGGTIDQPRVTTYARPPVIQTTVIADAPRVADAPVVGAPAPQVVYVATPPPPTRVVYVESYPRPVYCAPAPVIISASWRSGPYWHGRPWHGYRGPVYYHGPGHGGPDHHHHH